MEDYSRLQERLEAEVEKRDKKIEQVYEKMDDHYQTLDRKIESRFDKLAGQLNELPNLIYRRTGDLRNKPNNSAVWQVMGVVVAVFAILQLQLIFMANTATSVIQDMKAQFSKQEHINEREIARILGWQKTHDDKYPPKWLIDRVDKIDDELLRIKGQEV